MTLAWNTANRRVNSYLSVKKEVTGLVKKAIREVVPPVFERLVSLVGDVGQSLLDCAMDSGKYLWLTE